jgi:hypothetical protein
MMCTVFVEPCARCERKGWNWCASCNAKTPTPPAPPPSRHAMPTFDAEVPCDLAISLQTFRDLQALQTREIEPEDYDLLMLLSEAKAHQSLLEEEELRRVCNRTIRRHNDGTNDDPCAICLGVMRPGEELTSLACAGRHTFHSGCISEWLLMSRCCPVDKQDLKRIATESVGLD